MSILSSLYHGEERDLPNNIHNLPEDDTRVYERTSPLTAEARRRRAAMQHGTLRPTLYYNEEAQIPYHAGVWEPPHTVASKLEAREERPLG